METIEVIELTREEWDSRIAAEFARLGLTYEELAEQARTGDYASHDAWWLWMVIRDID